MSENSPIRRDLISAIFRELDRQQVEHVVLRNYDEIAKGNEKDIDLLVDARYFSRLRSIVVSVAKANAALVLVDRTTMGGLYLTFALPLLPESRPIRFHINPHVSLKTNFMQSRVRGLATRIRCSSIEKQRISVDGMDMWVPTNDWALLFLVSRLARGKRTSYSDHVRTLALSTDHVGPAASHCALRAAESRSASDVTIAVKAILSSLRRRSRGSAALLNWTSLLSLTARSLMRRHGALVIFSGPDGAGKSTTTSVCINFVRDEIGLQVHFVKGLAPVNNMFSRQLMRAHDTMRGVPSGLSSDEVDVKYRDREPSGSKITWKLRRLLGLIFYIAQYWPAYLVARIRNHLGQVVLVDTSVHDRFVKAHRPRYPRLERIVVPLLPTGDLLVQLRADPEKVNQRKPELTVNEIRAYYAAMSEILPRRPSVTGLDTDRGIAYAATEVRKLLLNCLSRISGERKSAAGQD